MTPSITLGHIAGIRISINWSWLVVFALIVWSLATAVFPAENEGLSQGTYVAMAVVAALAFFASLLLHELGHAVQARREGMTIEGITLWLFGGVAQFKGMFPSAGAEFRIAIAGPLVSAVLGGAFVGIAAGTDLSTPVDAVAAWLGYINLLLLGFNLLPALPLDGGRVFRSLLWKGKGDFGWATNVAVDVSRGFGYAMIAGGIFMFIFWGAFGGAWLAFIGWFLLLAAGAEARYSQVRQALDGVRVGDLMVRDPVTVTPDETLAQFMDEVAHAHRFTTYPVAEDDHAIGLLPFGRVASVPRREWEERHVRECMLPADRVPSVREDEQVADVLPELAESGLNRALVLEDGRLVGLLSITDVGRILASHAPRPGTAG